MSIARAFEKLQSEMVIKHEGVLIWRECNGFKVFGKVYPTIERAKQVITENTNHLGNSLKKVK
jgi:hypothetical protein